MKAPAGRRRAEQEAEARFGRRAVLLGALQAAGIGLIGWRLHRLQVAEADRYRLLAERNRINIRLLAPARGRIFDRAGVPLALNRPSYRAVIVREEAGDLERTLQNFRRIVPMSDEALAELRAEIERRSAFVPVTLAERLSWRQVARIAVNAPELPGISAEIGLDRYYPLGPDTAHVVGYVGPVSERDLERMKDDEDPLLKIPRFQVGKTNVERAYDRRLRGKAGLREIEVNAAGRVMRELSRRPGTPGEDIQLTIDAGLQNFAEARLKGESAAAVVIDVRSGELLASASAPGFDPNLFVRGIGASAYRALLENPYRPLSNKTVQGAYPPGSTFKMIVALAALEAGLVDPKEKVFCRGWIELGRRRFHCWKRGGHGHVDLIDSLALSCDVFYYEMAQRVGIERIAAMARRFGLGEKQDLPLSGISGGLVPSREWKERARGESWQVGDTLNAAIGQGFVLATPMQLAVMTARIASGRAVAPRLIRRIGAEERTKEAPPLEVDDRHLALVRRGMFEVANRRGATAYRSRIAEAELALAGKTGTSQVRSITAEERARGIFRNEDLPWERRDHALFVAFAPYKRPRYAISVVVEHGGGGSRAAAPIARDILLRALYGEIPPLSAYPPGQRREAEERLRALELAPLPKLRPGQGKA